MAEKSGKKEEKSKISTLRWIAYVFFLIFMALFTALVFLSTIYLRSFVMEIPNVFFLMVMGIFALTLGLACAAIFYALTKSNVAVVTGISIVSIFSTAAVSAVVIILNKFSSLLSKAAASGISGINLMPSLFNPYPNFILVAFVLILCLNLPAIILVFMKTEKPYHYAAAFIIIFLFTFLLSVIGVFIVASTIITSALG